MPRRKIPLVTSELYHVFNRGINRQSIFITKRDYQRAIETIDFYRHASLSLRLSYFLRLDAQKKEDIIQVNKLRNKHVEIHSYCLMPNHFHFLLRQTTEQGISKFMSNFQNSYTRYFNTKNKRDGSIFLNQFKAIRIESDEQFLHLTRYIHLNPYTSYIVKSINDLDSYPWSSFSAYMSGESRAVTRDMTESFFASSTLYKEFVLNQADYQRKLGEIKHLVLE